MADRYNWKQCFISQYDICQTISDRLPPQKHRKYLENIVAANYERCFAVFKQSNTEKAYGCLIYATGSVQNFATAEELDRFIKLNYPDSALPEMMKLEKFYNLMWQAIEKIKHTDPQKLAYWKSRFFSIFFRGILRLLRRKTPFDWAEKYSLLHKIAKIEIFSRSIEAVSIFH